MAIGWKNPSSRPEGRKAFHGAPRVVENVGSKTTEIVRPHRYADGQDVMGTPVGMEHTTAKKQGYLDAAGQKYRAGLRGTGGDAGNTPNATVRSKNTKRYGRDGSKGDFPHSSTGESPATLERRALPPSLPPTTIRERAKPHVEVVGFKPDGSGRHVGVTHPNAGRHGLDGIHDPHASTDQVQGQAWSASGGEHGRQSPRRGAARPSGTQTQDAGALDRKSYVPARKAK